MAKANLVTTHDRLTVSAIFSKELRANMTVSRRGATVSGKGLDVPQMREIMGAFDALTSRKGTSYGDTMATVEQCAAKATDVADLVRLLGAAK